MANQEYLDLIKQGVEVWNRWREKQPSTKLDLSDTSFYRANLSRINFSGAILDRVDFNQVILNQATLTDASLNFANLSDGDLRSATFHRADLSDATLHRADLSDADLSDAVLQFADLSDAILDRADFRGSLVLKTIFGNVDLRLVKNLENMKHRGPSIVGIDTIYRSRGLVPESFLRSVGVPDSFREVMSSIVNRPIEYYTVFISYSSHDHEFAERLYADLQSRRVRCWFAPEDLKIGDKIRPRIDESIRIYDKLLLVLSEHSVASNWVEHEVEMALAKEHKEKRTVLFPVRLDTMILEREYDGWPALVRHERHIGDFTHWKDHDRYQLTLNRLLRDLQSGI